ncbi:hypothetical protein C1H87_01315 [Flavivirga eckloniae]|uniref:Lipocalin-like domain-containing protein n=2 Tax=Flavivirga eckloniae TaxID=1803846 RepID=A0A2K9PK38_9FLAO|nr:hypothetical protein C1H87_01315 [Flavivirga eckloniae]
MSTNSKRNFDAMNPENKTRFKTIYRGRKLTFKTNGTFLQELSNGKNTLGIWSLENNNLVLKPEKGSVWIFKIYKLSDTRLILKLENKGSNITIMPKWIFTKFKHN